jgi:predicted DNA binding CopG/RHH family protein
MTKKRGYSRAFTPQTTRRVTVTIDRIPPTLLMRVKSRIAREGLSLRAVTLTLWAEWVDRDGS